MSTPPRNAVTELAAELADTLLAANPFQGSALGLREYDALLPDPSAAAEDELAGRLAALDRRAAELDGADQDGASRDGAGQDGADLARQVTLACVRSICRREQDKLATRQPEFTVTAMPFAGPASLLAEAARTALADPQAAGDYLSRLRAAAGWLDGTTERLREGRAKGRVPIGTLVDQAIAWADRTLADPVPAAFLEPVPPAGWDGAAAWRDEVAAVARDHIRPALARWREQLVAHRATARADAAGGLAHVPDGGHDYLRCIAVHTTLPLGAEQLHRIGLDTVAELEVRARELGARVGLADLPAIVGAVRASAGDLDPAAAIAAATEAIRRAERRAAEVMPAPLPGPCAVEPMPSTVGESGMAPHYTRPKLDGSRPGTYWFNTSRPTAGAGWDLEAVAFHEAVPGHHLQLARLQLLPELPLIQQISVTVHSEGWGLYAEELAGEFGLYSGPRAELGAVHAQLLRAARLVVDTGLHALGWSRERAIEYMIEHVALPEGFLTNEIDRYLIMPGQALAYLTGKREILRLRAEAAAEQGADFDLPGFHAAVLDSGSVPMPVLAAIVRGWVDSRRG